MSQSATKIMATTFCDTEGILGIDYQEHGVSIMGKYYASLLDQKRRRRLTKGVLLLHVIAPVHTSHVAAAAIHRCYIEQLSHPPQGCPKRLLFVSKMMIELLVKNIGDDDQRKSPILTSMTNLFLDGY